MTHITPDNAVLARDVQVAVRLGTSSRPSSVVALAVPWQSDLSDWAVIEQHFAVNLFGAHSMTQAFLPLLAGARGAVVNVLSEAALAPFPLVAAYSMSKAAALSMTQSLRAFLAIRRVSVHAACQVPSTPT